MKFLLAGNIVDTEADRYTPEDVCPAMVSDMIKGLEPNEPIELEITSYGGSVPAGLAISNMLKMASAEGHKTTAHVIGIAASMASAIACACDELRIDSNAFLMIHNPYTYAVVGDAGDMRKEADTLDKMKSALIAIYRTKFDVADEVIAKMMDEETWIIGADAETYKLNAEVIPVAEPLKAAAFAKELPKWLHIPQAITDLVAAQADEPNTGKLNASIDYFGLDNKPAEPSADESAEMITKAEADKRVSGMQSAMAKQIDSLKKDYEARITDFDNQLKAKDGELTKAQATVTSLTQSLEDTKRELAETASALAEKTNTLAKLNASVLTPAEELPTMKAGLAKCTTAAERVAFIQSGKYIK